MKIIRRIIFAFICCCLLADSLPQLLPKANAASAMTASEACVEFIKNVEGFSPQPYYDYKQYTVGYGTKCPTEKFFDYTANGIPRTEADALLRDHLAVISDAINTKLIDKYGLTLSQHQFDALVSFSFNIGTGWLTYDSSLRNAILRDAGDNDLVYAFGLYCTAGGKYLPGLITRRLCEANIYLNGVYHQKVSDSYGYVYYDANGGSLTYRVQGYVCDSSTAPVSDATRTNDVFLGWYTELNGGSQVTILDRAVRGKTLFARWQSSENTDDQDANETTVRVTGDVVNIRSGPGSNYGVVRRVYQNSILTVSHISQLTTMRWGKTEDGWICLDYTSYDDVINGHTDSENNSGQSTAPDAEPDTEEDSLPDQQNAVTGIVNVNDALRIRSGPGTNYSVVGFLFNGKDIQILEQQAVGEMVWGRISKGWVSMDYIVTDDSYWDSTTTPDTDPPQEPEQPPEQIPEQVPEQLPEQDQDPESTDSSGIMEPTSIKGIITADALRIRSGAGTNNRIVGFYYQNDSVIVLEKIQIDSVYWGRTNKGWINLNYLSTDASDYEPSQPEANGTMTVIADCLRVRKGFGTDHRIAELLYYGDTVEVFETETVDGTVWGRVHNGWICMDYVR